MSYRVTGLGISLLLHLVLAVGVYSWSNDKETATRTDAGKSMTLNMSMFSPEDPTPAVDSATKHILPNTPVETSEPPTSTSSLDTIEKPATQQSLVTKNTKPIEKQLEPKPKPKPKPKQKLTLKHKKITSLRQSKRLRPPLLKQPRQSLHLAANLPRY